MAAYNKQASEFIFRENNAESRVASDTIDLHGQFVEEAEDILEQRIRYAQSTGQNHLHVIVGKGNHSPHHIQKIKPRVEKVCQELGLQYQTEANEGRMYINLTGGPANAPPPTHAGGTHYGGNPQHHTTQPGYPGTQQHYQGGQPHHQPAHGHHQGQGQNDEVEKLVKKFLPRIIRKLERQCCIVM
jgi:Smr domain